MSDAVYRYGPGVENFSTSNHGGIKLSDDRNAEVHPALRKATGWYEEDCEWASVAVTFPELFSRRRVAAAVASLRDWNPDGWTAMTGEPVTAEQSSVIRRREFEAAHADDQVVVAAWRSPRPGMVLVAATTGGHRDSDTEERWFLVPKPEYDQRGERFVVDTDRHVEVDAVEAVELRG